MTVQDLANELGWKLLAGSSGAEKEVEGCFAGDLLSWVMSHGRPGQVWLTVQNSDTALAVAVQTKFSAMVLAGNVRPDEAALRQAEQRGVPLYSCKENLYEATAAVYETLTGLSAENH